MGTREALVGYACVPKGSCNLRRTDSLYSCRWSTSVRGHSEIYQYMSWVRFKSSFFSDIVNCVVMPIASVAHFVSQIWIQTFKPIVCT